jgi:hypothetical protein
MAYFLRAFCTSPDLPELRDVLDWAESQGIDLSIAAPDLDVRDWHQIEVVYKSERQPFVVEADTGEMVEEEVEEFIELLDEAEDSPAKEMVAAHLQNTRTVVAAQLLADVDDDGYAAVGVFLQYFVERYGGLIQADGEGFYEGDQLIVDMPDADPRTEAARASIWIAFHGRAEVSVPRSALRALAARIRDASGRPFDAAQAEDLAEDLERLAEDQSWAWVSWRTTYRPMLRWALEAWLAKEAEPPEWASELRAALRD